MGLLKPITIRRPNTLEKQAAPAAAAATPVAPATQATSATPDASSMPVASAAPDASSMSATSDAHIAIGEAICLAPMAGTSSVAFRSICKSFGASYCPTELVSARSILYNGIERSFRYLEIDQEKEGITCIQLFGSEPSDFEYAIRAICEDDRLKSVDIIDINMGCPVPKVIKTGAGCALMLDESRAAAIARSAVQAAASYGKPVTVKTRIGFDDSQGHLNGERFASCLCEAGIALLAVHGRTGKQMYHGNADMGEVAKMAAVARAFGVPFLANGDIVDGPSAKRTLEITGADGIMIGRAACGNPWLFEQVRAYLSGGDESCGDAWQGGFVSKEDRLKMLLYELELTCEHKPEKFAVREMRPQMAAYVKGVDGAAALKRELCQASTVEEVRKICKL